MPREPRHGTAKAYRSGCHCNVCRIAEGERKLGWRRRRNRVASDVDHRALGELLRELCPDGLTSPDERIAHPDSELLTA